MNEQRTKILIMIDSLTCGGAEKSLISLLPFLAEQHYDITLMLCARGGLFEQYVPKSVKTVSFPFTASLINKVIYSIAIRVNKNRRHSAEIFWRMVGRYYPRLKQEYDVAIAYQQGFPTYYIAEKVRAKKKICWINADIKAAGYSKKFNSRFYNKYDTIVAVSDVLKDSIVYPDYVCIKERIITVWDILNETLIRDMALSENVHFAPYKDIHITTVGRLVPPKGYDLAISAARILKDKGINFQWHFVGGGFLENALKAQINNCNLGGYVVLEGVKVNPYPYMANADIYVQTSKFEGFGITIGEAKILGRPIVSTNFPVVYNQISNGKNGLVVGMSGEEIADGILRLVNDGSLIDRFRSAVSAEHNTTSETESRKVINIIER